MGFEKLAEQKIREAYSILKNANCLPEEIHLLSEVSRLESAVAVAADEAVKARLSRELQDARLRLALALERLRADSRRPSSRSRVGA